MSEENTNTKPEQSSGNEVALSALLAAKISSVINRRITESEKGAKEKAKEGFYGEAETLMHRAETLKYALALISHECSSDRRLCHLQDHFS